MEEALVGLSTLRAVALVQREARQGADLMGLHQEAEGVRHLSGVLGEGAGGDGAVEGPVDAHRAQHRVVRVGGQALPRELRGGGLMVIDDAGPARERPRGRPEEHAPRQLPPQRGQRLRHGRGLHGLRALAALGGRLHGGAGEEVELCGSSLLGHGASPGPRQQAPRARCRASSAPNAGRHWMQEVASVQPHVPSAMSLDRRPGDESGRVSATAP